MVANNEGPNVGDVARRLREIEERLAQQAEDMNAPPLSRLYRAPTDRYQVVGWSGGIPANNFELQPALIRMVQADQFGGRADADPNAHLSAFLDICDTIKINGVSNDVIRMTLFDFSLRDWVKDWYKSLDRAAITTWDQLCQVFLDKYFPPSKAQKIIAEITHFSQLGDELIYEAWERYRDLLRKCFHNTASVQILVDAYASGCLVNRSAAEAWRIIEEMAANNYQWPMERQATRSAATDPDSRVDDLLSKWSF